MQALLKAPKIDESLIASITSQIKSRYQSPPRFRFRSSTNAEDLKGLNGAGMYKSANGCTQPEEGSVDPFSPENCFTSSELARKRQLLLAIQKLGNYGDLEIDLADDLSKNKTSIAKALKKVYASLWSEKAFLFRDYYGLPHESVFMGVLAHPAFIDETANGVAILKAKGIYREFSVTVQLDDISITNPEIPNSYPDQIIGVITQEGKILDYNYVMKNNMQSDSVLSQFELENLLRQLVVVFNQFQSDSSNDLDLKLDFEFKRAPAQLPSGPNDVSYIKNYDMEVKQARPL